MPSNPYAELAELAGGFIHDIKNHLSTLNLNLGLLAEDFTAAETARERRMAERVARMQDECARLVDLSNDFLRFARIQDLDLAEADLSTVIVEMLDFFGPVARQHDIEIKSYVPAGLQVALDLKLFKDALLNLMLNAQQAMPDGGEMTIQAVLETGCVALSIIDTGKGMTPEVLARAFQPFYSTRAGGTGLGLPTTRRIVEAHGGSIAAESAPGTGTRFTLRLPLAAARGKGGPEILCLLNGSRMPLSEAKISVLDRAYVFGDAIYEVLRLYAGKPWLEDDHFSRLERSLEVVQIRGVDLAKLRRQVRELIAAGPYRDGLVYIQVSRGVAPRAHAFPSGVKPTELVWVQETGDPFAPKREKGVGVVLQPDLRWKRCDVKSVNLLANVLANQAAKEAGATEAILYTEDGTLTEATHSSFFGVVSGVIRTTALGPNILPGVTRLHALRLCARLGLKVEERSLHRDELPACDELFLSGTSMEICPIISVDGKPVADGKPGPVTQRLQEVFRDEVAAFIR